jgi:hypothetical protein
MIGIFKEKGKYWFVTKEDVHEVLIERNRKPRALKPKIMKFYVDIYSKNELALDNNHFDIT